MINRRNGNGKWNRKRRRRRRREEDKAGKMEGGEGTERRGER